MSRPAFSPPHTVGQFRCPIDSTRQTHLINRSPAAEACRTTEGCKEISEQHVPKSSGRADCIWVDVRRHLQLSFDRVGSGGHLQPYHRRECISGDLKEWPGPMPDCSQCFRFNRGNSTLVSTRLGSGVRQKMPTTRLILHCRIFFCCQYPLM